MGLSKCSEDVYWLSGKNVAYFKKPVAKSYTHKNYCREVVVCFIGWLYYINLLYLEKYKDCFLSLLCMAFLLDIKGHKSSFVLEMHC